MSNLNANMHSVDPSKLYLSFSFMQTISINLNDMDPLVLLICTCTHTYIHTWIQFTIYLLNSNHCSIYHIWTILTNYLLECLRRSAWKCDIFSYNLVVKFKSIYGPTVAYLDLVQVMSALSTDYVVMRNFTCFLTSVCMPHHHYHHQYHQ